MCATVTGSLEPAHRDERELVRAVDGSSTITVSASLGAAGQGAAGYSALRRVDDRRLWVQCA
jgi:hypothetical protein